MIERVHVKRLLDKLVDVKIEVSLTAPPATPAWGKTIARPGRD